MIERTPPKSPQLSSFVGHEGDVKINVDTVFEQKKEIYKKGNEEQKFEIFVENFNKKFQEIAADFNIIYDF